MTEHVAERPEAATAPPPAEPDSMTPGAAARPALVLPAFGATDGGHRGTTLLIAVNTAIALVCLVLLGTEGELDPIAAMVDGITRLHEVAEMDGRAVDDGQVWRLFSSFWVHYGLVHLIVNMVMLGLAGWKLESALGTRRFLGSYLVFGLAASVATYFAAHDALTAGASGAIFGVLGALLVVRIRLRLSLVLPIVLLVVGAAETFLVPGVAIAAHVVGALVGAVIAAGYAYSSGERRATIQRAVPLLTLASLLVLVAAAALLG
ncbi:MAG TPA: rhomboid family intramembrane serine protease [Pseudonocardiaceae bacterium]